jgi:hypothetical protein
MTPQRLVIQTRRPRESDPGAVAETFWIVSGDAVYLCDADGVKTGEKRNIGSADPKNVAISLLRNKVGKRNTDFSRPLHYPKLVY